MSPPILVAFSADIEKEDLLGFEDIKPRECQVELRETLGVQGDVNSGMEVNLFPAQEGKFLLDMRDDQNDKVDYKVSVHADE